MKELVSRAPSLLAALQAIAGTRVLWRLRRTACGERIVTRDGPLPGERVTVIVPVLNEHLRLEPCLIGLSAQPVEVAEILVVDGGSRDGTADLVLTYAARDARIRLMDASPVPSHWNGKAYGLQWGLDHADAMSRWVLTIDADVRVAPALVRSLLRHARRTGAAATSVATRQRISGAAEALFHPALLTTLVYRFGIPGSVTDRVAEVQANGQCCLFRRGPLERIGGFRVACGSVCEDVTVARALAASGYAVGFAESDGLAEAAMYESWRDAWRNWTRSLPLRDRYSGLAGWIGLLEVTLAQALPLPLLAWLLLPRSSRLPRSLLAINLVLMMVRLGVLAGTSRAYAQRPWTYWISPLVDLPVAIQLWRSALRRRHRWRGRVLIRDDARDQP